MTSPVVALSDVFVVYRGAAEPVLALRGADFSLAAGERLLVTGPNGSGKSTLLRVVTGEQDVLAGRVEVGGAAVHAMNLAARRRWRSRAVGSVDQHARRDLLPELDVLGNVSLQLRLTGMPRRRAAQQAQATLDRLGLGDLAGSAVTALSGGEAQRVALSAAVAYDPALLLADEPTGELDDAAAADVYALLEVIAAGGTGVVLVSHDPRAEPFVDRAVRLEAGRVAEQWSPGSGSVTHLPDSRGWLRLPTDVLAPPDASPPDSFLVDHIPGGLLLRPVGVVPLPAAAKRPGPTTRPQRRVVPSGPERPVELEDVTASYPHRLVFRGFDLHLTGGTWTAVRGPSGSGKSTLLALVAGLIDPAAGRIRVGGTAWTGLDRGRRALHRARWLAYAPQRPALIESLTLRENLALVKALHPEPCPESGPEPVAELLGLTSLLDCGVDVLSGGERQRSGLARALLSPAPILLLDEPTSQQDDASAGRVVTALRAEAGRGRTVLLTSHDQTLLDAADHLVRLGPTNSAG